MATIGLKAGVSFPKPLKIPVPGPMPQGRDIQDLRRVARACQFTCILVCSLNRPLAGGLTVLSIATFIVRNIRRERRHLRSGVPPERDPGSPEE